jgi:hypothetical protein
MAEVRGFMSKKIQIVSCITGKCRSDTPDSGIFVSDNSSERTMATRGQHETFAGQELDFR